MRQREEDIVTLKLWIGVVTFQTSTVADQYVHDTRLPWPVLVDPDRALYRAYGMDRGSWWSIWGPSTLLAYARLLARGRSVTRTTADTRQLGGDVLIDPTGRVALHHVGAGPADRPAISTLIEHVRRGSD